MGIVAGVGFAMWYCIGVFASHSIRRVERIPEPSAAVRRRAWWSLITAVPVFVLATTILARYWQNEQLRLLDQPEISSLSALTIISMAFVVFVLLFLILRGARWVYRRIQLWIQRLTFLPPYAGTALALVTAAFIIVGTVTGLLERTAVVSLDSAYEIANNYVDPSYPQPASSLRSGSTESYVSWDGLGREGRRFMSRGPGARDIEAFTNVPAKEPIRVYAGLNNADGRQAQVALVVEELERTRAFDRKMMMVAIPTGSGWIEPETVAAFEYMHGGDTVVVSAQYSYLPSGLALIVDQGDATAMAKELLHAVESKMRSLSEDSRPKLVLYGLSLGSYGGQNDFTGEEDFRSRLDAGLFVGSPGFSEPMRAITRERDLGSREVEPIYNNEQVIKFVTDSEDIIEDTNPEYKIVYFHYATDPFVWFNGPLLYRQPDWMREAPGRAVSPHLRWFPLITFTQIAIDQMFALAMPGANGHDYADDTVPPMVAATKPDNWNADKSRALQALLAQ